MTGGASRVNDTHDPELRSWVEGAHAPATDFPIQNLPFGVFRHDPEDAPRVGIAIGDHILDCLAAAQAGRFDALDPSVRAALQASSLNPLMALGRGAARGVRGVASRMLRSHTPEGAAARDMRDAILVGKSHVELLVPATIGDYTDFYASIFHATNVGSMFRPENPLLPNYKYVPIGYHGRASSIVASGTPIARPSGQTRPDPAAPPVFGPTRNLDYELEIGAYICGANFLGEPVPIAAAEERLFGLSLLNDWSARDMQAWEYQPLGPFLAKNFATTVSPWVVTLDALEPFRATAFPRPDGDPPPLPYLTDPDDQARGGFDITLEASISSREMRDRALPPFRLSSSNVAQLYWTMGQLLTHHASNGCNLNPGDLIGSGTVSGPASDSRGCLLELTWRGTLPIALPSGESRTFLADGDEVIFRAWCEREGAARIGFGECRGEIRGAI